MDKVNERMEIRRGNTQSTKTAYQTSREIKESEIQKAIKKASCGVNGHQNKKQIKFSLKRVALALVCAVTAVFVVVYFVNKNSPDVALKVAALQTGIDAVYPNYVPRNYKLSDITSEDGKITLNFKDQLSDGHFTLVEEKSSWDSTALYNNYIIEVFGSNYTTVKEGGLTIYIGSNGAAWVNGGILYKLKFDIGLLTKKQITSIATK